jgi:hypothetical protein
MIKGSSGFRESVKAVAPSAKLLVAKRMQSGIQTKRWVDSVEVVNNAKVDLYFELPVRWSNPEWSTKSPTVCF